TFPARVLNAFLVRFFASRRPSVVYVREFIRRNDILRLWGRLFFHATQEFARLPLLLKKLRLTRSERYRLAVLDARSIGGAISISELEQIWHSVKEPRRRVLCFADG